MGAGEGPARIVSRAAPESAEKVWMTPSSLEAARVRLSGEKVRECTRHLEAARDLPAFSAPALRWRWTDSACSTADLAAVRLASTCAVDLVAKANSSSVVVLVNVALARAAAAASRAARRGLRASSG